MAFRARGEVGVRIAERLDSLGYSTVVDGARFLGVSRGTLSRWLHGHVAEIDMANRRGLAAKLGGEPSDYLTKTVTPGPPEQAAILARYDTALTEAEESRELLVQVLRELRRIQAGLVLAGIELPRDVERGGGR